MVRVFFFYVFVFYNNSKKAKKNPEEEIEKIRAKSRIEFKEVLVATRTSSCLRTMGLYKGLSKVGR